MSGVQEPLRLGVMFSGGASSLRYLIEHDPNYGTNYQFVAAFSSSGLATGIEYTLSRNIKTSVVDYNWFCKHRNAKRNNLAVRQEYCRKILTFMREERVEAIILSGFMLLIMEPLLSEFSGRILNVHPALLSQKDESGQRLLTGLDVVRRAMDAGLPTGSTVHIVTKEADMGPIVAEVRLPYAIGADPVAHQEKMKTACDGPAYVEALQKLIANGWPKRSYG